MVDYIPSRIESVAIYITSIENQIHLFVEDLSESKMGRNDCCGCWGTEVWSQDEGT
jgi:hypothetical protein